MHSYDITETENNLAKAEKALILLHGRGATAENILTLADHFTDESWYVAAPQATNYQWYPYSFMVPASQNEPWLGSAVDLVKRLIDKISENISHEKIFLMGFSQGACLSLEVAARFATKYGGVAAFTGGLIGEEIDRLKYNGNFNGTRIYISNGDNDPHIPRSRSFDTQKLLTEMGGDVKLDVFPGRIHTILQEEIDHARSFLLLS
jgi:phospholipase/carboxylesterase